MAGSEIIVSAEILHCIDEQRQITREAATYRHKTDELARLAQQVNIRAGATEQALSPLTKENTPLAELDAVLKELPRCLSHIQQLENMLQDEGQDLQQHQFQPTLRTPHPEPMPVSSAPPESEGWVQATLWIAAGAALLLILLLFFFLVHSL